MIKPGEIDKIAIEKGVRAKQIEKDLPDFKNLWRKSSGQFKDLMKLLEN